MYSVQLSALPSIATLVLMVAVLVTAFPQQDQSSGKAAAAFGSTYDEIVVETQLSVRPKAASVGLRAGRAKPVFFRPNATGAETRFVRPTTTAPLAASSSTSTTTRDGISYAARVVGVENPLAAAKVRSERARRESTSSSGSYSSSFHSSSSSGGSGRPGSSGFNTFSASGGSVSAVSRLLPSGRTVSATVAEDFKVGPGGPSSSVLKTVFVDK